MRILLRASFLYHEPCASKGEKVMKPQNQHFHTGLIMAVFLGLVLVLVQPVAADYSNEKISIEDGALYWMDLGGLFATYGNYPAAIEAYKKALAMDPNNSEVHFDLSVAYGELGDFDQALSAVNKAISIDPDQGRYYYGRAWVYLLAGNKDRALLDFQKAADMGELDAIMYLQRSASAP